mmetsp:Transcript_51145/g.144059  ORF Transcript_51145/g.144059 Transcript_51145/m.144059 type:complete len:246 (-) Transcript_51145:16-753(-)
MRTPLPVMSGNGSGVGLWCRWKFVGQGLPSPRHSWISLLLISWSALVKVFGSPAWESQTQLPWDRADGLLMTDVLILCPNPPLTKRPPTSVIPSTLTRSPSAMSRAALHCAESLWPMMCTPRKETPVPLRIATTGWEAEGASFKTAAAFWPGLAASRLQLERTRVLGSTYVPASRRTDAAALPSRGAALARSAEFLTCTGSVPRRAPQGDAAAGAAQATSAHRARSVRGMRKRRPPDLWRGGGLI